MPLSNPSSMRECKKKPYNVLFFKKFSTLSWLLSLSWKFCELKTTMTGFLLNTVVDSYDFRNILKPKTNRIVQRNGKRHKDEKEGNLFFLIIWKALRSYDEPRAVGTLSMSVYTGVILPRRLNEPQNPGCQLLKEQNSTRPNLFPCRPRLTMYNNYL